MAQGIANSVGHLELRTGNLACACAFYTRLFGWRAESIDVGPLGYMTLGLADRTEAGVVEQDTPRAFWLPYVEVADIAETAERARALGATVIVPPREGPAGWRSVLAAPATGMVALWQPKT
jgi:predicted enzyme related to lactoylglutathione lyase